MRPYGPQICRNIAKGLDRHDTVAWCVISATSDPVSWLAESDLGRSGDCRCSAHQVRLCRLRIRWRWRTSGSLSDLTGGPRARSWPDASATQEPGPWKSKKTRRRYLCSRNSHLLLGCCDIITKYNGRFSSLLRLFQVGGRVSHCSTFHLRRVSECFGNRYSPFPLQVLSVIPTSCLPSMLVALTSSAVTVKTEAGSVTPSILDSIP